MTIFKKKAIDIQETKKLPMTGKVKKGFRAYCTMVIVGALALGMTTTAFAANDPLTVVNNLSDFIFGLIRAIGKGGNIWNVIVDINGAVQAIGLALLVLFFVIGMVKTCGSFTDVKKPEHALKLFVRFALAKGVITYGMELMLALFNIVQGTISTIMNAAGFGTPEQTTLPAEMVTTIEDCGFFESIPLWAVTLIG